MNYRNEYEHQADKVLRVIARGMAVIGGIFLLKFTLYLLELAQRLNAA